MAESAKVTAYLQDSARQKLSDELDEEDRENADFQGAYDILVKGARDLITPASADRGGEAEQAASDGEKLRQAIATLDNEESAHSQTLRERDRAQEILDRMTSIILDEQIDWANHEAKWSEAVNVLLQRQPVHPAPAAPAEAVQARPQEDIVEDFYRGRGNGTETEVCPAPLNLAAATLIAGKTRAELKSGVIATFFRQDTSLRWQYAFQANGMTYWSGPDGKCCCGDESHDILALLPDAEQDNQSEPVCRGCGRVLDMKANLCDGCPCNSPKGINHGLVPKRLCTCPECDPEQTGAPRPVIRPAVPREPHNSADLLDLAWMVIRETDAMELDQHIHEMSVGAAGAARSLAAKVICDAEEPRQAGGPMLSEPMTAVARNMGDADKAAEAGADQSRMGCVHRPPGGKRKVRHRPGVE